MQNLYIYLVSVHYLCAAHTVHCSLFMCSTHCTLFTIYVQHTLYTVHYLCAAHTVHCSLFMCSTHCTLSCRILIFSLPTSNSYFQFAYSEIPRESAWWVLLRPPWC